MGWIYRGWKKGKIKRFWPLFAKKGEDTACLISVDGVKLKAADTEDTEEYSNHAEDNYAKYAVRAKESLM